MRDEVKLATVEMTGKAKTAARGAGLFGGGGVMALVRAGCLLAGAIIALAGVMRPWLAALIVGVALFAAAGIAALAGKGQHERLTPPVPSRAADSVKADVEQIKESARRISEGHRGRPHARGSGRPHAEEQALAEQIEQTRQQLGETVEALAAKADVKGRARTPRCGGQGQPARQGQRGQGQGGRAGRRTARRDRGHGSPGQGRGPKRRCPGGRAGRRRGSRRPRYHARAGAAVRWPGGGYRAREPRQGGGNRNSDGSPHPRLARGTPQPTLTAARAPGGAQAARPRAGSARSRLVRPPAVAHPRHTAT